MERHHHYVGTIWIKMQHSINAFASLSRKQKTVLQLLHCGRPAAMPFEADRGRQWVSADENQIGAPHLGFIQVSPKLILSRLQLLAQLSCRGRLVVSIAACRALRL